MRFRYGKKYEAALKKFGVMNETMAKSLESVVMLYCSYYKMFGLKVNGGCESAELWQMWREIEFPSEQIREVVEQNLQHYYLSFMGNPQTGLLIRRHRDGIVSDWYIEHPMRPKGLKDAEREEEEDERRTKG